MPPAQDGCSALGLSRPVQQPGLPRCRRPAAARARAGLPARQSQAALTRHLLDARHHILLGAHHHHVCGGHRGVACGSGRARPGLPTRALARSGASNRRVTSTPAWLPRTCPQLGQLLLVMRRADDVDGLHALQRGGQASGVGDPWPGRLTGAARARGKRLAAQPSPPCSSRSALPAGSPCGPAPRRRRCSAATRPWAPASGVSVGEAGKLLLLAPAETSRLCNVSPPAPLAPTPHSMGGRHLQDIKEAVDSDGVDLSAEGASTGVSYAAVPTSITAGRRCGAQVQGWRPAHQELRRRLVRHLVRHRQQRALRHAHILLPGACGATSGEASEVR